MVFLPPGHGKSSIISETFPAWLLISNPKSRIALVSYEHDFITNKSRHCRDLYFEWGMKITGNKLSPDRQAADHWEIEKHRLLHAVRVPYGEFYIIIDDPIKNAEQAQSETYRNKMYDWYLTTLRTRLEPHGRIIIIQTRWHEDDLAGRLLRDMKEKDADKWKVLNFPAIAEENDSLGRKPGEALWPTRYPIEVLEATQRANTPSWWAAMYQGNPRPNEGNVFQNKFFRYFTIKDLRNPNEGFKNPGDFSNRGEIYFELNTSEGIKHTKFENCITFQTIDPAATEKTYSDYFVVETWILTPQRDLLLIDVYREQAETTKHLDILRQQRVKWNPSFQGVENKTFGLSLIQSAKTLGFPIKELQADTDKVSRALTMKTRYEMGTVYHLANAPWLYDYESELTSFPNGKHDDMVDCASYAGILLGTLPIPRFL